MKRLFHYVELPPVWLAVFAALAWGQAQLWPLSVLGRAGDVAGTALVAAGWQCRAGRRCTSCWNAPR